MRVHTECPEQPDPHPRQLGDNRTGYYGYQNGGQEIESHPQVLQTQRQGVDEDHQDGKVIP